MSDGNGVRAQEYVTKPSLEELAIKFSNLVCACARRDDCSQINWPCLRITTALSTALVLLEWFVISCDTGAQCFQFSAKRKTPFRHLNWLSPQKASGPLFKWETGRRAATAFHIYRDLYLSFCRLLGGNWKLGFFIITNQKFVFFSLTNWTISILHAVNSLLVRNVHFWGITIAAF